MPFDFDDADNPPAAQIEGPVVSVRAQIRRADFGANAGPHRFGGPLALTVRGAKSKPLVLHRVLTLSSSDPLLGVTIPGVTELPLVYGFVHDACHIEYRVISATEIEMVTLPEEPPSTDWPYEQYPAAFPSKPFALRDDGTIDPDDVDELTWQGLDHVDPKKGVVAIVPPSALYGVSLWGDGDAEQVQVVFEVNPAKRTVVVSNQCS